MAEYEIDGPDGHTYRITGPENATREQIVAAVKSRLATQPPEQGSLYDPKNPVLSDDPRYWPPQTAPKAAPERGTFVPLVKGESGKFELGVPGIAYDPFAAAKEIYDPQNTGSISGSVNPEIATGDPVKTGAIDVLGRQTIGPGLTAASAGPLSTYNRIIRPPSMGGAFTVKGGGFGPKGTATRDVARAAQIDYARAVGKNPGEIDPARMEQEALETMKAARDRGQDLRLLDVGAGGTATKEGELVPHEGAAATRGIARRSANLSTEAWGMLDELTKPRQQSTNDRIIMWLTKTFHKPEEGLVTLEQTQKALQNRITPAYEAAYRAGADGIEDAGLLQMFNSDEGKAVLAEAFRTAEFLRTSGAQAKHPFFANVIDMSELAEMSRYQNLRPAEWGTRKPTLAFWDRVKRVLDSRVSGNLDNPEKALPFRQVRDVLKDRLFNLKGEAGKRYRDAVGLAAQRFSVGDAFEAGEMIAGSRMTETDINRLKAGVRYSKGGKELKKRTPMSAEELKYLQAGYLYGYLKSIKGTNLVLKYARDPVARRQVMAMLGPREAGEFEAILATEAVAQASRRAAIGNSTTPAQAAAIVNQRRSWRDLGFHTLAAGIALAISHSGLWTLGGAAMSYAALQAKKANARAVADHIARMLTSHDPRVYSQGIKIAGRIHIFEEVMTQLGVRAAPNVVMQEDADTEPGELAPANLPPVDLPVYDPEKHMPGVEER